MKKLLVVLLLLSSLFSFSQSETHVFTTYDTLINAGSGFGTITWRLRISRPTGMFGNGADTASRPLIMFSPGQGQMGTNYGVLQTIGPHYWLNNGWDGGVVLANGTHYPILITAISSNTYFSGREYAELLNIILNTYHIKRNSVHIAGLSQGGFASSSSIYYERTPGDEFGMKQVTSLLSLQGIDEWPNGYPNTTNKYAGPAWQQWATKYDGKFLGLEGTNDARQIHVVANQVNAGRAGNGYLGYETIGGGYHCCWQDMMSPGRTNWRSVIPYGANMTSGGYPTSMGTYKDGDYLMKWMFRQGDTSMVGAAAVLAANAGTDATITLPASSVTLNGSGTPASGTTITGYAWTRISGPNTPTESASNAASNTLSGLVAGTYIYRLTVTTNIATTATDDVTVVVNAAANIPPVVSAGATQTITFPLSIVTMAGTASDPDGSIASTSWSRISGPNTPLITLISSLTSTITGLIPGTYVFRLTATDNVGASSTSDVNIVVNPLLNTPPVVSAGPTQTITLPISTVTMAGSASDPDGTIASATWSRVSGPNTPAITTPSSYTTTITGLIAGTYVFRLSATDNSAATTTSDVTITVNPGANVLPVVSAGSTQTITLPISTVTMAGSASDPDGTIASAAWSNVSGPNTPTITTPSSYTTTITGLIAGTYVFRLSATDNSAATVTSDVTITVNAAANVAPIVNAGPTQTITLPISTVTMAGSASDPDGTIASATWSRVSGPNTPAITMPGNYTTTITGLIAGTYVFRLSATDNSAATSTSDVTITVNAAVNVPPVVSAGPTQTITLPASSVTMAGSANDPDGTIASAAWSMVSGPNIATITTPSSYTTTITGLIAGTYVFRLSATDNSSATTTADVSITVNAAGNIVPVVSAGSTQTITLPASSVTMAGSASDPDGTIASATWSRVSGPNTPTITTPSSYTTTITGLIAGTYVFRLSVTDNSAATSTSDVTITVNAALNVPPIVSAGSNQTITLPASSVTMAGSASDPDGTIASATWSMVSGPNTPSITMPGNYTTTITGLIAGTYVFRLTATDNSAAVTTSDITVTVYPASNVPPVVSAGPTQTITLPASSVTMAGSASDPDGTIASASWSRISGPNTPTITTPSSYTTTITGLVAGTYVFRLSATDNSGVTSTSDVTITVNAAANIVPVVNAGATQTITLPVSSVTMAGSASDPDGTIASASWSRISGPNTPTITTPSSYTTTITGLVAGTYVFRLSATDNSGATSTSDVTITVNTAANMVPVVSAGSTQAITLPASSVTMAGSASDPDGTIASSSWSRISGPNTPVITTPSSYTTTITGLIAGTYVFRLSATDNNGATSSADVTIIVNSAVAGAGTKYVWNSANDDIIVDNIVFGKKLKAGDTIIIPPRAGGYGSQTYQGVNSGAVGEYVVVQFEAGAFLSPLAADNIKSYLDSCSGLKIVGMKMYQRGAVPFRLGNSPYGPDRGVPRGYSSYIWIDSAQLIGSSSFENSYSNLFPDFAGDTTKMFHHWKWTNCLFDSTHNKGVATPQFAISLGKIATYGYWRDVEISNCVFDHYYSVSSPSVYINCTNSYNVSIHNNTFRNLGMTANPVGHAACVNYNSSRVDIFNNVFGPNNFANDVRGSNTDLLIPGYMGRNKIYNNVTFNKRKYPFCDAYDVSPSILSTLAPYVRRRTSPEIYNITAYNMAMGIGHIPYIAVILDCFVTDTATVKNCVFTQMRDAPWATSNPRVLGQTNGWVTVVDTSNNRYAEFFANSGLADSVTFTPQLGGGLFDQGAPVPSYNTKDLWGYNRTAGAATDIGAVEYRVGGNQPPIAAAGSDIFINSPATQVSLDGSGSSDFDGSIVSYVWTKSSGGAATITTSNAAATTVTGLVPGTYVFQLTVTDNSGNTGTDFITVTVNAIAGNVAPIAIAGPNQSITIPTSSVTLAGSGTDSDGSITGYSWTKISGPAATITSAGTASTTVTGLVAGVYQFQLTVTDNSGSTGTDIVTITVNGAANQAPVADAGSNLNITLPANTVTLIGSGTDADGTVTGYAWTKISGPAATISNASAASTDVTGLVAGIYQFQITVTDNSGATATDIVTVTVNAAANQAPIADAGVNQVISLPTNSVTLSGSGTDADGTITAYGWTKLSGPAATITSAGTSSTTVTGLVAGTYQFELTVTDDNGATASDIVTVIVNAAAPSNQAPIATAGGNLAITLPTNSVTLNGSGTDADGTITAYSWTKLSGPAATITSSASQSTTVTGLVAGTYQFQLTVTDNNGATGTDIITVTVNGAANQAPIADAGANINITLPTNSVTLVGSGIDPDGIITGYSWTKLSGPAATISSASSASTMVTGLVAGVYQFELEVTDNSGVTAVDVVTVTVNAVANQLPIAYAGVNLSITLPNNSVSLNGSGTDADGSIVSYSWTQVSGPAATISTPSSAATTITGLTLGVYQFRLEVIDNNGGTATDVITVTVNAAPVNTPPIAYAGADHTIYLPASNVILDGSGSFDPDGTIVSYSWTKISGPNPATLVNATTDRATLVTVFEGVYEFELTIVDNSGAISKDRITMTVLPAGNVVNQKPIANAGSDASISVPAISSVLLDGSRSSDPDGTIVSYAWRLIAAPAGANTSIVSPAGITTTANGLSVEGDYIFELTVTDNNGESAKDTVIIGSINTLRVTYSMQLFPNPVSDLMKVRVVSDKTGKMSMRIFDALGRFVQASDLEKNTTLYEKTVNVSHLMPGPYFIRMEFSDGNHVTQKFIKL